MDKHDNFAKKLSWIRKNRGYTYAEFSKELDLPKSTIETIMNCGNTTLHTAIQISERLGIPLDLLLSDEPLDQEFNIVQWFMHGISTFSTLSAEQQYKISLYLNEILKVLRDHPEAHE